LNQEKYRKGNEVYFIDFAKITVLRKQPGKHIAASNSNSNNNRNNNGIQRRDGSGTTTVQVKRRKQVKASETVKTTANGD
jgi:hypothetical protein